MSLIKGNISKLIMVRTYHLRGSVREKKRDVFGQDQSKLRTTVAKKKITFSNFNDMHFLCMASLKLVKK